MKIASADCFPEQPILLVFITICFIIGLEMRCLEGGQFRDFRLVDRASLSRSFWNKSISPFSIHATIFPFMVDY